MLCVQKRTPWQGLKQDFKESLETKFYSEKLRKIKSFNVKGSEL